MVVCSHVSKLVCRYAPSEEILFVLSYDRTVRVYETVNMTQLFNYWNPRGCNFTVAAHEPSLHRTLIADECGYITVLDSWARKAVFKRKITEECIVALAFLSHANVWLDACEVLAATSKFLQPWSVQRSQEYSLIPEAHDGAIVGIESMHSPDFAHAEFKEGLQERIFTAGKDNRIVQWDGYEFREVRTFYEDRSEITTMHHSNKMDVVVTGAFLLTTVLTMRGMGRYRRRMQAMKTANFASGDLNPETGSTSALIRILSRALLRESCLVKAMCSFQPALMAA